ncbi:ribosomal RNA small subunit methyltransferase A [Patescibacteria group bacterium]|nr:ribosomal RNA small subunit methyltransferase A [Patescibacteria group bacterium]
MLKSDIQKLLKEKGIWPKKKLGQNFLISQKKLNKIVEAAQLSKQDIVLEIGPGLGILTKELALRAKKVIAIEKDAKMVEILQEMLVEWNIKNVEVAQGDILKIQNAKRKTQNNSAKLKTTNYKLQTTNYKLIANLPYNIATKVITMFLESDNPPETMVLMVQKEVGERICEGFLIPKSSKKSAKLIKMSGLAIFCQFYADVKIIASVSNKSFWPCPKVDSVILKILPTQKNLSKINKDLFFKIVKAGFSHPRKQLAKNFKKNLGIASEQVEKWLLKNNIKPNQRAESLRLNDWKELAKSYKNGNYLQG